MLVFPGLLTLWLTVLSDTGAAILVILNSLRLLKIKSLNTLSICEKVFRLFELINFLLLMFI